MDEETPGVGIGTGIAKVLEAAGKMLAESEVVGTDLDDIFWSSVNADVATGTDDSLDSTFYRSIVKDGDWMPKQQELSAFAPPSGKPVIAESPAAFDKNAVIDQVAEFAVREVERLARQNAAAPGQRRDILLFSNGDEKVYVGGPGQYSSLRDNPKESMKGLLNIFYRENRQELEQLAQHVVDNAVKGTPIDIGKWIGR
jgi:hypothetical protein